MLFIISMTKLPPVWNVLENNGFWQIVKYNDLAAIYCAPFSQAFHTWLHRLQLIPKALRMFVTTWTQENVCDLVAHND